MIEHPSWLARILNSDGSTAGTGFAIDSRHVVTCSHLAIGPDGERIQQGDEVLVEFSLRDREPPTGSGRTVTARAIFSEFDDGEADDLAVLAFDDPILDIQTPPLHRALRFAGREVQVRGFPWRREAVSPIAAMTLSGASRPGWVQLNPSEPRGWTVEHDFSGGPVWDTQVGAVIGMVVTKSQHDSGDMITIDRLCQLWPPLAERIGRFPVDVNEYASHWEPRARGVSTVASASGGSRFSGRSSALKCIIKALAQDPAPNQPLVVTGQPGAGKSAVLARIVTTACPAPSFSPDPAANFGVRAAPGSVHCAVHASGKTPEEIAQAILLAAGIHDQPSLDSFPAAINAALEQHDRFNVIIDALDEASPGGNRGSTDPARQIITAIITPLARAPKTSVIVGTRAQTDRNLLKVFSHYHHIDLDSEDYFNHDDLVAYAETTLRLDSIEQGTNTYIDSAFAGPVARRIAAGARKNFLVAGLVAHAHGFADTRPADPSTIQFTGETANAFELYLDRLPTIADLYLDPKEALTALAFAETPGFTAELWATALQSLEGTTVDPRRLERFARSAAANFLIEVRAGEQLSFQLFHQALIDAARKWRAPEADESTVCQARLTEAFHTLAEHTGWTAAPAYLSRSLATHAAAGNRLEGMLESLDFLSHADPATLVPALRTPLGTRSQQIATAYREGILDHRTRPAGTTRAQRIRLDLARAGIADLDPDNAPRYWQPQWCAGATLNSALRDVLPGNKEGIIEVAFGEVNGAPIAITAGGFRDEIVRVWDLESGRERHRLEGHTRGVSALAFGKVSNGTVAITGGFDGLARVWDLETGRERLRLEGHTDEVSSVAFGRVNGSPVAVTAGGSRYERNGTVLLWDLETGRERHRLEGLTSGNWKVAFGEVHGSPIAIIANRNRHMGNKMLFLWDLETGRERHRLEGHTGGIDTVAFGEVNGSPIAITDSDRAFGSGDLTVRVWDLETGHERYRLKDLTEPSIGSDVVIGTVGGCAVAITGGPGDLLRLWDLETGRERHRIENLTGGVRAMAFGTVNGHPVAVIAGHDGPIRVWDLERENPKKEPESNTGGVRAVAFGGVNGCPVAITASLDRTLRVWDLETGRERHRIEAQLGRSLAVTLGEVRGCPVAIAASGSTMRVWDLETGSERQRLEGHTGDVFKVAFGGVNGCPVAITASLDRTLRVWDLETGRERHRIENHSGDVKAVAFGEVNGSPIAVTGDFSGLVRVWDLDTGRERHRLEGHVGRINATVIFGTVDGCPVAITDDGTVRVWDLDTGRERCRLEGHTGGIGAVAFGTADGRPIAVEGITDDGTVRVWDLDTGRERCRLEGHTGGVDAVAFGTADGRPIAFTGSTDRTVALWDLRKMEQLGQLVFPSKVDTVALGTAGRLVVTFGNELMCLNPPSSFGGATQAHETGESAS